MDKRQLTAILVILFLLFLIEFVILMSLVYFAELPFFLFLFTVALRILSFFLLGFIVIFLTLTLFGKKPEFTIEWWIMHFREYKRFFGSVFVVSCVSILISIIVGGALAIVTERFFLLPYVEKLRHWIQANLK